MFKSGGIAADLYYVNNQEGLGFALWNSCNHTLAVTL